MILPANFNKVMAGKTISHPKICEYAGSMGVVDPGRLCSDPTFRESTGSDIRKKKNPDPMFEKKMGSKSEPQKTGSKSDSRKSIRIRIILNSNLIKIHFKLFAFDIKVNMFLNFGQ